MQSRAASSSGRTFTKWWSEIGYNVSGWQSFIRALRAYYLSQNKLRALVDDKDLPEQSLNNYYVNLALITNDAHAKAEAGLQENSMTREEKYQALLLSEKMHGVNELFPSLEGAPTGWVSVTGRAGTGKTTLEQYIAYCWGTREACWYNRFDFVFRVKLNLLRQLQFLAGQSESHNLAQLIYTSIETPDAVLSLENIRLCLERYPNQLLLLLDGFDEIQTLYKHNHAIKRLIDYAMHFPNGMITTRPDAMPLEWQQETPSRFVQQFENVGLTENNVRQYVTNYFQATATKAARPELSETLLAALFSNPEMMSLAQIPVNVAVFCLTWEEEEKRRPAVSTATPTPTIFTMTQLYHRLIVWLTRRYCVKFQADCPFDPQAAREEQLLQYCQTELATLSTLAYRAFIENKIQTIDHVLLEECISDQALLHKISKEFGALRALGHPERTGEYAPHYFIHLTYQEYFAALYIAQKLSAPPLPIREEEIARRQMIQELAFFIQREKDNPVYKIVWTFLAGLVSTPEYARGADYFWDAIIDIPLTSTSFLERLASETSLVAIGLHPNVRLLQSIQGFFREALLIIKTFDNVFISERLMIVRFYLQSLLTWNIVQQTEALVSTWWDSHNVFDDVYVFDDEKYYNITEYRQRILYKRQSQQRQMDISQLDAKSAIEFSLMSILSQLPNCDVLLNNERAKLQSSEYHIRRWAVKALGGMKVQDTTSFRMLRDALQDSEYGVWISAAEALVRICPQDVEALQILKNALRNSDYRIQQKAVIILVRLDIHDSQIFQILKNIFHNLGYNDIFLRPTIISALWRLNVQDAELLQVLQEDLKRRDECVRIYASEALGHLGMRDTTLLQVVSNLLKSSENGARIKAVETQEYIGIQNAESLHALRSALKDSNAAVRSHAVKVLGRIGAQDAKSLQALENALEDSNWHVRISAREVLIRIRSQATVLLQQLRNELKNSDGYVRRITAETLGFLNVQDAESLQALGYALWDSEEYVRRSAAWAFNRLAITLREEALQVLLEKANDDNETSLEVSYWVHLALLRIPLRLYLLSPELISNETAQYIFVASVWLHGSSVFFRNDQLILDNKCFSLMLFSKELSEQQAFIQALQNQQEKFIYATGLSHIIQPLREPIILPQVTKVFEPSFLTDDLPAAPEDRLQTMIHTLEQFSARLSSLEVVSQEQQGEQGRLSYEVKSALDHIRSLQQQAATTVTDADFNPVAEQITQLEMRLNALTITPGVASAISRLGSWQATTRLDNVHLTLSK